MDNLTTVVLVALITAFFTSLATEAGKKFLGIIFKPFRAVGTIVYSVIAPRFPYQVGLRGYKRKIARSNLSRIENPVGPSLRVSVARAFAPVKLYDITHPYVNDTMWTVMALLFVRRYFARGRLRDGLATAASLPNYVGSARPSTLDGPRCHSNAVSHEIIQSSPLT